MYATASPAAGTPRLSGLRALASHMQAGRFQSSQSAAAAAPPPAATGAAAAEEEFKVYISADIEGIGGVVNEAHLGPGGFEYEKARQWMTAETVAAAEAALEAGASSVVISDSHGNGCNIMPDELPPNCKLVRSWPRELGMMCGLDSSFACAMLIGFHPGTASLGGVRAHTFSSSSLTSIKINGVETSESGIAALTAGELGVPIIMASGDNFLEEEIHATLGDSVEVAVVKTGLSFVRNCMHPLPPRLRPRSRSPLAPTRPPVSCAVALASAEQMRSGLSHRQLRFVCGGTARCGMPAPGGRSGAGEGDGRRCH